MLIFATLLIAAMRQVSAKPSLAVVERIEYRLSADSCVKPLQQWWRHYAYWHEGKTDKRYVQVWFIESGHDGLRSGRFITEPEPPVLDDSQFRLVSGKYQISTGHFVELFCGLNHPRSPASRNVR